MFSGSLVVAILLAAPADCGPTPYDCAVQHVTREEFAPAMALLQKERARRPGDLKVLNLLGIALTGAGRVDEANAHFRAALARDPAFSPAQRNLGVNEFNRDRLTAAEKHFLAVLKVSADDDVAHLYLGEIQHRRKKLRLAVPHYEKSRARVMKNPVWLLHYAEALLAGDRRGDAAAALDEIPVADAESRFQAGMILGRHKAYAEAARLFASARSAYRDPYAAGYNQVLMLVEGGLHDAATAAAEALFAEGTKTAELLNLASRAHLGAGRVKEAYDSLRAAIALAPQSEQNYLDLAAICLEHQNHDLGIEIVDIGLRHLPTSLWLRLQRGVLLAEKGTVAEAAQEFEKARALAPRHPAPQVGLAMAWMQMGEGPRAVDVLRAPARAAKEPLVPYIFGLALLRTGADPEGVPGQEAQAAFQSAIKADPGFSPARAELGKLLLKRGDVEGAIAELEKVVELDPDGPGSLYMLARAYQRKGDKARAEDTLRRVSRLRAPEGENPDADLRKVVIRIFKEGAAPTPAAPPDR